MAGALTKAELSEATMSLKDELLKGEPDGFIAEVYGWDAETFKRIKRLMFDEMVEDNRSKPREVLYAEYQLAQQQGIQDLTDLIANLDKKQQYNALVGAMRLRSDLHDRILDRGMDLGVIRKEPERKEIVAGVLIADLSTTELREAIVGEMTSIKDLMVKFGDADIRALKTGSDLHYGEAAPPPEVAGIIDATPSAEGKGKKKPHSRKRRPADVAK